MVNHKIRAEDAQPCFAFGARSGSNDLYVGERFQQLHGNRTDPARAAHQQQGATAACHEFVHVKAVKQRFPRGERGERQRGGLGKIQCARFLGGDTAVHRLQLGIRTLTVDAPA